VDTPVHAFDCKITGDIPSPKGDEIFARAESAGSKEDLGEFFCEEYVRGIMSSGKMS